MDISVVINTHNEAKKLTDCLLSVKDWVDEIVVVDMESTDETVKVAKDFGAKIFPHKHLFWVEPARNFALQKAGGDWILVLDPDERVPKILASKLKKIVEKGEDEVVNIPRKNIIFGKWIKHTNWWPDRQIRFFKKGMASWDDRIHLYPKVKGRLLNLPAQADMALEHLNYETISQFLDRQNRYSEIAAQNRFDEGEKFSWWRFFWRPKRVFLQRYLRHAGFLDGFYGLALSFLAAYSQLSEEIKLWEKEKLKSS